MAIITVRIAEIRQETPSIRVLKIDLSGQEFFYKPGQWIDCYADIGLDRFVVGYSLASSPITKGFIELAVKKSDNPVTQYIHSDAKIGDKIYIEGGQGDTFYNADMGEKVVLAGAGIGFAPLMGILRYIDEATISRVAVFQSASSFEEIIYFEELKCRSEKNPQISYHPSVSQGSAPNGIDSGRITGEMFERYKVDYSSIFFLSGPGEMIPDLEKYLMGKGVPYDKIKYEQWW